VSNALRYDALLVRDLAAELHERLAGARLDAAFLERDRLRVTLRTRAARRSDAAPPSLLWQLHPESGALTTKGNGIESGGRVQLATGTRIVGVTAPPDARILVIELDAADAHAGAARAIVVELMTNQWNALAMGADGRITAVLRERATKGRELRAGAPYVPPPASGRAGADAPVTLEQWRDAVARAAPGARLRSVLGVAYVSPLNAAAIIGDADIHDDDAALERARERYLDIVWRSPRQPVLLPDGQPYSVLLPDATMQSSLLDAFDAAAGSTERSGDDEAEASLTLVAARLDALDRRVARLMEEQAGAQEEAARLRAHADVLMTQLHRVARGAAHVELHDFEGAPLRLELDPTLNAAQNATRMYDAARRRDRAAARIPGLIEDVATERARLETLAERVRRGVASAEEIEGLRRAARTRADAEGRPLPYREYRTRGGLEVRVGRGSKANDELTFRHSSPGDIWLHARDVAGAHVILRWPRADANPPAADIHDAAVLAALYSRARTSGLVAVDWTRRKHVRKPRKSAPGAVIPERVKTVFVEPDPSLEESLRQ